MNIPHAGCRELQIAIRRVLSKNCEVGLDSLGSQMLKRLKQQIKSLVGY